jgi:hypothetical protein
MIAFETMEFSFLSLFSSYSLAAIIFIVMIAAYWIGCRVSQRFKGYFIDGFGPVEGSLLGLLALLLAFTFSMSAARYETRRQIIVQEARQIGTAILRADLYEPSEREAFRADFKEYVEVRIACHDAGFDDKMITRNLNQSVAISTRLWDRAARLGRNPSNFISSNQMIPALNSMIDTVTTRNAARHSTVPDAIIWVLFILCAISSFMIGINRKESKSSMLVVNTVFALMISACVFLIIDLDRPKHGLITTEEMNQNIIDLRGMFNEP